MPMTPGLAPNIRQPATVAAPQITDDSDIEIRDAEPDATIQNVDDAGNILSIEFPDGSIQISTDDTPLGTIGDNSKNRDWFDNLADEIPEEVLTGIASELLTDIEYDIQSRKDWIEEVASGLKLLGFKVELPGIQSAADGAPVEGMSKVRHPLLAEAVLRFQANARSELLPVDGPVKIRDDNNNANLDEDKLANALEKDLNHFLTSTAKEYYPDTDRMLLMLGFAGTSFKKGYNCPLRNRPVLETVEAEDLMVHNSATSLSTATRITHRIMMSPSTVKRMQILEVYRDVDLATASLPLNDALKLEKDSLQGKKPNYTVRPDDRDREIYECYCELDIKGFEHKLKGKETGLKIPYRVTIDVSSRTILSIVRNYDEDDQEMPEAKQHFVQYLFVPGTGFYGLGLLHILGNATNAITAAWRELLDAGMYNNFPGFLMADSGMRQNTNIIRVPPGGAAPIKVGTMARIQDAVMPLPYKEPSTALMQLVENIAQTGMRVGGTSEMQVGEGRPDAPVGTTLAMIEQATKVLNAVHKRMHSAQAEEFALLIRLFKENPKAFWQKNRHPTYPWDEQTFINALEACESKLVPQADPNTASHGQRLMKLMALKQLQAANPTLYDPIAIDIECIRAIGYSNPEQFMAPPEAQGKPPPELQEAMAKIQNDSKKADAQMLSAQANMVKAQKDAPPAPGAPPGADPAELVLKKQELGLKAQAQQFEQQRAVIEDENRDKDRQLEAHKQQIDIIQDLMKQQHDHELQAGLAGHQSQMDHLTSVNKMLVDLHKAEQQSKTATEVAKHRAKARPKAPAKKAKPKKD